jgi:CRISPR-associated endonuclease Csy4
MTSGWLKGIRDHLEIGEIKASPKVERHVSFTRVAPKSKAQMIKRAIKKGMPKERIEKIEKMEHLHLKLPFANLQSLSNGNKYRVFIMRSDYMTQPMSGDFDSYGLSRSTTVPWF